MISHINGGELERVSLDLNTKIIGKTILGYDVVDSTNDIARKLINEGAEEGTVVLANVQKAGKGRLNRKWLSPKGGLWLSIILKPDIKPHEATKITLIAGVAVARTLANYDLDAKIKWPNDVLIKGKKVCGILIEVRTTENNIDFLILGLGINANFDLKELPEQIRGSATTLRHEMGRDLNIQDLLSHLLSEIEKSYVLLDSDESNLILTAWKERCDTLGSEVKIITQNESVKGTAMDVDEMGALMIKMRDGTIHKFVAGDCMHLSRITE